jgi:opacity protein-like surface antigen
MKGIVLLTAVLLAVSPRAPAEDRYVGIAVGPWLPDTGGTSIRTELDQGIAGELRAGWRFAGRFAAEAAIGGFQAERTLPPADVTESTLHSVAAGYLVLTGRAFLPLGDGTWRLGAAAGVGYYSADLHIKQPPSIEVKPSESDTGFHLGVGAHWAVTQKARLALEYRLVQASPGGVDVDGAALQLAAEYHY